MSTELIYLCLAAFAAGFVDAVVGGGGLIQIPAALVLLPGYPVSSVIGTTKIPSFVGTSVAAYKYTRHVDVVRSDLSVMMPIACISAFLGSRLLTQVSSDFMKPFLLAVLACVAVYTYTKKDFGVLAEESRKDLRHHRFLTIAISVILGFYDGFIGPGTGSFLLLTFITMLGYDFMRAGASAKFVNLSTNIGSIVLFIVSGSIIWHAALPMAICNGAGGYLGARLAILRGNLFIRIFFLVVVLGTMLRFAYDVFR